MATPRRAIGQTAISVSLSKGLLEEIDARASLLGLTRSQYFAQLARQDLTDRPEFILREKPVSRSKTSSRDSASETGSVHKAREILGQEFDAAPPKAKPSP